MVILLELLVIFCVLVLGTTQVVLPLWRGEQLFPMLHWQAIEEQELAEAEADLEAVKLARSVLKRRKQTTRIAREIARDATDEPEEDR